MVVLVIEAEFASFFTCFAAAVVAAVVVVVVVVEVVVLGRGGVGRKDLLYVS